MKTANIQDLGSVIRSYREASGLSIRELARQLDVPYTSIAKMENGDQKIDSVMLIRLADLFEVSLDQMLNRQGSYPLIVNNPPYFAEGNQQKTSIGIDGVLRHILEKYTSAKLAALKDHELGDFVRTTARDIIIKEARLDQAKNLVVGSVGQGQWAEIPWISLYLRNITTTATMGYYVVFLFTADMEGVYISLNQGWSYFKEKYGTKLGKEKVKTVARLIRNKLNPVPERLRIEKIDLRGKGNLSMGYEGGHIYGRYYSLNSMPETSEIIEDLQALLISYKEIESLIGPRTIEQFNDYLLLEDDGQFLENAEYEEKFQENVLSILSHQDGEDLNDPGEEEHPEKRGNPIVDKGGKVRWPRDAKTAAESLRLAGYECSEDAKHTTFISKTTGKPFMESHHLVPMKLQGKFDFSLDKKANILALCPKCHRLIHHGTDEEKEKLLFRLFESRVHRLRGIGIDIDFETLKEAYGISRKR